MSKGKKLGISIFIVVLTVILIAVIICTVGINYIFGSSSKSGRVFGKNIYVMSGTEMMPEIEKGAAVIADESEITVFTEGNVILFKQDKDIENVMRIKEIVYNTDSTIYRVASDSSQDKVIDVNKENVIAKCVTESKRLGSVITFLKSITGILTGMILPCLLLLVMLLFKIRSVRNKSSKNLGASDEFTDEFEKDTATENGGRVNPLFDPVTDVKPDMNFEIKKSSIAENFGKKPLAGRNNRNQTNPAAESAVEKFRAAVDEKPSAPVTRRPSLAPFSSGNDKTQKMAAIKAALNNDGSNVSQPENGQNDYSKTTSFRLPPKNETSFIKNTEMPRSQPKPQTAPVQNQSRPTPKPVPKKQDNIHSIDDLIKALEEEKKKL